MHTSDLDIPRLDLGTGKGAGVHGADCVPGGGRGGLWEAGPTTRRRRQQATMEAVQEPQHSGLLSYGMPRPQSEIRTNGRASVADHCFQS